MFVGHALFAFALVAGLAGRVTDPRRALAYGAVAAAFAAVPDVDIGYALVGLGGALGSGALDAGPLALASTFWETGNVVHRAVTHSLVVAPIAALAAAAWVDGRPLARLLAVALAAVLVAAATILTGALAATVTFAFAAACLVLATVVASRTTLGPGATFVLALVGLVSHPFGDFFTGEPPALFYPISDLPLETVTLHPDPTLHLLAAFGIELATVWAALLVWIRLREGPRVPRIDPKAATGAAYAGLAFLIPAPTLDLSYPFVFSVLAVGLVGIAPRVRFRAREFSRPGPERAVYTGLTAITVAALAYAVVYLVTIG
ncbi:metal-dependent hydrolase [Halorarum halobium]|uniref:metal-dependent hydrolase n=1 Tax=Halorarum halobium TaxID=3075121 RepID=UPI0028AFECCB|nr:metal-dependent hydrolase [Halobaculum sp. XH14]